MNIQIKEKGKRKDTAEYAEVQGILAVWGK